MPILKKNIQCIKMIILVGFVQIKNWLFLIWTNKLKLIIRVSENVLLFVFVTIRNYFIAALDEDHLMNNSSSNVGGGGSERVSENALLTPKQRLRAKHRELFLSRQVETLPATHIRGKCSVTLLNETEALTSYLNKEVNAIKTLIKWFYVWFNKSNFVSKSFIFYQNDFRTKIPWIKHENLS